MIKWILEKRNIEDLKENPKNPRRLSKHDAEQLSRSLEKFGLADKPICNTDGTIIGGHQRKKILQKLKYKEVEVWVPDHELTPDECDELCIRLNRNHGEFDDDILANRWDLEKLIDYGFVTEDFSLPSVEEIADEIEKQQEKDEEKKSSMCPSCGYEY